MNWYLFKNNGLVFGPLNVMSIIFGVVTPPPSMDIFGDMLQELSTALRLGTGTDGRHLFIQFFHLVEVINLIPSGVKVSFLYIVIV